MMMIIIIIIITTIIIMMMIIICPLEDFPRFFKFRINPPKAED